MNYADIATRLSAILQLVAAVAALIGVWRGSP